MDTTVITNEQSDCSVFYQNKVSLLSSSSADRLFNNPVLHRVWWSIWAGESFQKAEVTVKQEGELLVHLPLYIDDFKLKKIIRIKRIQFIGSNYQNIVTPRIEYLEFIFKNGNQKAKQAAFDSLCNLNWDDFIVRDVLVGGVTSESISALANIKKWLVRVIHKDTAYSIDCSGSFESYLGSRGKNTRLKLYNRRKLLHTLGEVSLENYFPKKVDCFFQLLEGFHRQRWGDVFSEKSRLFHKNLIKGLKEQGFHVVLSVLKVDDVCESLLYDIHIDGKIYNIQSGYNSNFNKKISLGTLHFGYAIEDAFDDSSIECYDFLAGEGKHSQYKESLATNSIQLHSLQVIRSRKLILLFKVKEKLQQLYRLFT